MSIVLLYLPILTITSLYAVVITERHWIIDNIQGLGTIVLSTGLEGLFLLFEHEELPLQFDLPFWFSSSLSHNWMLLAV
ncbi:hypothetical protein BKA57DRAFT_476091 [Linnemannia elongata]|nr:hypothetical protein BKA57DRAFT_476091 [Linnemannia elongata]